MKILIKTNNLSREEWLKYRTLGIGGSDVSIIAGLNHFKSIHQLWLEKTGLVVPEESDSEFAHFGTLLEPIVRQEFTARTGIKVRAKHAILQSSEYPFMHANLDGIIHEDNGDISIFEAKTASAYKKDIWEEGVPAEYILQIQHYMAVTGAKKTYIAALVGGNHFFYHEVARDDEMIAKIIAMEEYFWEHNVIGGVEPIPDGSEATTAYFNEKFAVSNGKSVALPDEVLPICTEYDSLSRQIKNLENARIAVSNQLIGYLKEYEVGTVGDRKVIWKSITKNNLDTKRLRQEQPDIYDAYLSQSQYRRLSIA